LATIKMGSPAAICAGAMTRGAASKATSGRIAASMNAIRSQATGFHHGHTG